jgi:cyclic pyranopterin phosphate synthase
MNNDMKELNHFNEAGEAHMVDVGGKQVSARHAVAQGRIQMQAKTLQRIADGTHSKGDVLGVARIAGIMAAKKTAELVPLCHPIALTHVEIDLSADAHTQSVVCQAVVETRGVTGVEMEALNAVQVSLLTVYDMCKAIDRGMTISDVGLLSKSGGQSGDWRSDAKILYKNDK